MGPVDLTVAAAERDDFVVAADPFVDQEAAGMEAGHGGHDAGNILRKVAVVDRREHFEVVRRWAMLLSDLMDWLESLSHFAYR